jgi:2-dehydropantoate 2-reductase
MKIGIVGAGAVGTYLACKLSRTADVTVAVRASHVTALRKNGLTLSTSGGETLQASPTVVEEGTGDTQDVVIVCVKAFAVPDAMHAVVPLMAGETHVAFVQNGIPWWYRLDDAGYVNVLDPDDRIGSRVSLDRVIGGVAYVNVQNRGAGHAHHVSDDTFALGHPKGHPTPVLEQLASAMRAAGITVRMNERIQQEIWVKLWGSLAFNPISALTGATMDRIIGDATTRPVVMAMMEEARAVAERSGIRFGISIDQRLEAAARAGAFKTSMLQDLEAGRRMEIDAILGAVVRAARSRAIKAPTLGLVLALLSQKAETLGLR